MDVRSFVIDHYMRDKYATFANNLQAVVSAKRRYLEELIVREVTSQDINQTVLDALKVAREELIQIEYACYPVNDGYDKLISMPVERIAYLCGYGTSGFSLGRFWSAMMSEKPQKDFGGRYYMDQHLSEEVFKEEEMK